MKKMAFGFIVLLSLLIFVFLNMGKWIDVTDEPVKSDIIVCLGGGTIERVKKSIELLKGGYAEKQAFLLLGESWYNQPYIKKNHPDMNIVIDESPQNTKEEVIYIKRYMAEHGYKSALIVTDPPHSRRVSLLTSLNNDDNMTFRMLGSDVQWWDAEHYYKNERARDFVWHEVVGIAYELLINN